MFRNENVENYDPSESNIKAQNSVLEIEAVQIQVDEETPRWPLRTLISSIILFVVGTSLLLGGLIDEFVDDDPTRGMAMWIVGAITFIPGFYYSFLFFKAFRAKTVSERLKILRDIPDIQ